MLIAPDTSAPASFGVPTADVSQLRIPQCLTAKKSICFCQWNDDVLRFLSKHHELAALARIFAPFLAWKKP